MMGEEASSPQEVRGRTPRPVARLMGFVVADGRASKPLFTSPAGSGSPNSQERDIFCQCRPLKLSREKLCCWLRGATAAGHAQHGLNARPFRRVTHCTLLTE